MQRPDFEAPCGSERTPRVLNYTASRGNPMSRSKVTLWVRLLLGVAVIVGGPLILIAVLRTAYQSSPEPGKIDPGTFEFGKLGPSSPASRPSVSPRPPAAAPGMHATRLYECRKGGQLIYSGQPCGPDSIEREVNVRDANTSCRRASQQASAWRRRRRSTRSTCSCGRAIRRRRVSCTASGYGDWTSG